MHWIPASQRKPKSGEHVIVLCDGFDRVRCHAVSAGWFDAIEDWLGPDGEVVVGVTHWTYLEEPPPVEHLLVAAPEPASPPDPPCASPATSGASEGILAAGNSIENETVERPE